MTLTQYRILQLSLERIVKQINKQKLIKNTEKTLINKRNKGIIQPTRKNIKKE